MSDTKLQERGRQLLNAVELILDEPASVVARADELGTAERVIKHYSDRTALAGGLAAAPGLLPGWGTVVAVTGGMLADMALMLKYEVEMALALCHLHGHDISSSDERRRAFLLASVETLKVQAGRNPLLDLATIEATAIWRYAPREASKLLVQVLGRLALAATSRNLFRALPLVGMVVGSSVNKVLTERVGRRCVEQLDQRDRLDCDATFDLILDSRRRDF